MAEISVIIPVFNTENYLGRCLDSVLGQTLRDIEVICVDDCSTDGSSALLAGRAAQDGRITVIGLKDFLNEPPVREVPGDQHHDSN